MALFTFVLDYRGGTYLQQVEGPDPRAALVSWAATTSLDVVFGLSEKSRVPFQTALARSRPIAVKQVSNVWCASGIVRGHLALVHLVETVPPSGTP